MLEVSSPLNEARLEIDFAEIYANSPLYKENQALIKELSAPLPGYEDLSFPTKYSQNFYNQCVANIWKQYKSYWKNPPYNAMRYLMMVLNGLVFGTVFWQKGIKLESQQDLFNLLGATYAAVFFLGASNCITVQPVVAIERTVFYREKAAGMYSSLSYALAQTSVEIIYNILQGCLYTVLIYSMIGYEWKAVLLFPILHNCKFQLLLIVWHDVGGIDPICDACKHNYILCTPSLEPVCWIPHRQTGHSNLVRWYYWANPVSWTIYGVVASQFGENNKSILIPRGSPIVVKKFLEDNLGIKHDFLGYVVLAHFVYTIGFYFIFGYSIKVLNFQKR